MGFGIKFSSKAHKDFLLKIQMMGSRIMIFFMVTPAAVMAAIPHRKRQGTQPEPRSISVQHGCRPNKKCYLCGAICCEMYRYVTFLTK
jgi:hypothetical protein